MIPKLRKLSKTPQGSNNQHFLQLYLLSSAHRIFKPIQYNRIKVTWLMVYNVHKY